MLIHDCTLRTLTGSSNHFNFIKLSIVFDVKFKRIRDKISLNTKPFHQQNTHKLHQVFEDIKIVVTGEEVNFDDNKIRTLMPLNTPGNVTIKSDLNLLIKKNNC